MPPDMTAGLMPLVGTPPSVIAPGKPATGPPGTGTPSTPAPGIDTLFAALLAQSGAPTSPQLAPKQLVSKEAVPSDAAQKEIASQKEIAALPILPNPKELNPKELNSKQPNSKQSNSKQPTSENLKPMDTLLLSLLPTEKAKEKASELPLHQASADTPDASAQVPVPASVPSFVPSSLFIPIIAAPVPLMLSVPVFSATAPIQASSALVSSALVSASGQSAPLPGRVLETPPAVSLPLPRTFAVTAPASVSPPAPIALLAPPAIAASVMAALPLPAGLPSLGQTVSKEKPAVPGAVKAAAILPQAASLPSTPALAAAMPTPAQAQAEPVITGLNTAAPPQALPSSQVLSALPPVPSPIALTALAGPNLAAPVSAPGKVAGKSTENPLKSPVGNADNNTRTFNNTRTAAVPVTPAQTASEKHGEAQADPMPLDTLLAGTQPSAIGAGAAPATESKPISAADRAEMARQVSNGVGAMPLAAKPGAAQQMSLQLHPKDWGSLQVSVTVVPGTDANAAKTVTAHIVAETPQVKAALESQTGALTQALRASGLHLEHLTVSVKPPEVKLTEIKPASESASAGMSSNQGQPGSNAGSSQTQAGQSSGFASFAGSSQNGRQGQPQQSAFTAVRAEPEVEETRRPSLLVSQSWGRIDTRA